MRKALRISIPAIALCGGAAVLAGAPGPARAAITGNLGTTSVPYGAPLTVQTINTGFGNAPGGTDSTGGSELDAGYGAIDNSGNLDLFLSGNFENNGNHLNIFVHGGDPGQNVLNAPATATLQKMNGSVFSPGFQATWAFDMNDYQGTLYNEEYTYGGPGVINGGYVGSVPETSTGIAPAAIPGGGGFPAFSTIALNNLNGSTMGPAGAATNQAAAAAVQTGFEISIPLSQIGWSGGPIMVLADINGGGDTYLSNQFLPGLAVGTGNVGGGGPYTGPNSGTFNFANSPGQYFTVQVPEPASIGVLGAAALMLAARRRKA
jgi:hypothetical protein